jgi:hypothetical protein
MSGAAVEIVWKEFAAEVADKAISKLDAIQAAAGKTANATAGMGAAADKALGFLKGAGILAAISLAYNELQKFHAETRRYTAALADQSDGVRLSTDAYQALVAAQDRVGNSQDKTTASLGTLNAKVQEAAGGGKSAIDAFDKLGVKLLDNDGKLRSQAQILQEVAQGLVRMGDADQRAALAKDLLGVSGVRTEATLRQFAMGLGEAERQARNAGQIIGKDTVDAAVKLETQSKATQIAFRAFYAEIGMPVELASLKAIESVVGGIAMAYRRAADEEKKFKASVGERAANNDIAQLEDQLGSARQRLATNPRNTMAQSEVRSLEARIAALRPAQVAAARARGQEDVNATDLQRLLEDGLPATGGGESQAKVTTGGGGGGGGSRDRIGENLRMVTAQAEAAWKAFDRMRAGQGMVLDDLRQQVDLEKNIADELAKLGKYDANDPRIAALKQQVTEREKGESALRKYLQAARDAEGIEKQLGDGTAFLRAEMNRLNDALDTGRLGYETYAVAVKQAQLRAEELRLTQAAQKDGIEGFIGGWQLAAYQANRATTAGQLGAQAYADSFQLMRSAVDEWAQTGVLSFDKVAAGFGKMLTNMALAYAQSQLGKAIFGDAKGGGGGLLEGLGNWISGGLFGGGIAGTGVTPGTMGSGGINGGMPIFGNAAGGSVSPGVAVMTGERGPELFVPRTGGTIIPADRTAAMMGGGDMFVTINNHTEAKVETRKSRGPGGQPRLDVMIANAVSGHIASQLDRGEGPIGKVLAGRYGVTPR